MQDWVISGDHSGEGPCSSLLNLPYRSKAPTAAVTNHQPRLTGRKAPFQLSPVSYTDLNQLGQPCPKAITLYKQLTREMPRPAADRAAGEHTARSHPEAGGGSGRLSGAGAGDSSRRSCGTWRPAARGVSPRLESKAQTATDAFRRGPTPPSGLS